ncbi:prolactin-6A1 isoform X1 [Mus caroli]|uniref:Prolactin-6A1 isoform X1 n=1 Tax=Mus caroli TaxID=10089 RepID=A0A6P5QQM6_MUSCR|nr:prolactin-6A1 isoform X1 [Mus caroli]XP_021036432.1 prolactin-6A1 isoform X1 [Mus caroli]XP_021036433.1 prolactin-6A1 isoform X1 [Mus caroli]XP_021036434.1 prolactin-6A1 isoform X1 [Mus caroli]
MLSLSQPYFSGTLLILLASNFLLWKNVASVPMHASWAEYGEMSIYDLLDHATILSHNVSELTAEMHGIFMEDVRYKPGRWFSDRYLTACHTSTLTISVSKEGARQMPGVFLVKEMISMLTAWRYPLYHIITELSYMEQAPDEIISRARNIEEKIIVLIEVLRGILSKIQPEPPENERYPVWNELASLQSPDEDLRHLTLFNLFQCLVKDSRKIDSSTRLLKCKLLYNRDC